MRRPWSDVDIQDCGERLESIRERFLCLEPHPYAQLGAPYGQQSDPFRVRSSVLTRLTQAQNHLTQHPDSEIGSIQLLVFDAWRPVRVQAFMVEHAVREECRRRGLKPTMPHWTRALEDVQRDVGRFWAVPSDNPCTPPPHSTGGAIDLTLADACGAPLAMGGEIDAIGPESLPDHHAASARRKPESSEALWHLRRCKLRAAMEHAGFVRHPNEWWHFSYGDQLWAWKAEASMAIYGRVDNH